MWFSFLPSLFLASLLLAPSEIRAQSRSTEDPTRDLANCFASNTPGRAEACSRLLARDEFNANARFGLYEQRMAARLDAGDFAGAISDSDRRSELQPSSRLVMVEGCFLRAIAGLELDAADRLCEAALAEPTAIPIYSVRGVLRLKQNRNREAWTDFDRVVAHDQGASAQPLYGRGIAALRLGRVSEGQDDLAAAERINPGIAAQFASWGVRSPLLPVTSSRPSAPPPAVDPVTWLTAPVPEYPERALRLEVEGDVYLTCNVLPTGRLNGCIVVSEPLTPLPANEDYGFGQQAIRAAQRMAVLDMTAPDRPAGPVTFQISFRIS